MLQEIILRFASTHLARYLSRYGSRAGHLSRGVLPLLFLLACIPAFSQAVPAEPDPLARIRAQAPAPACSEAEPTLCAEAAPKIIANATGSDSTIQKNLSILASGEGGHAMGAPPPQSVVDDVRVTDWAVAAFRAAGLDTHTEPASPSAHGLEDVVAEIRGRENPNEVVILAAAIDPSAIDNSLEAAIDATVLPEAARDIAATGLVPGESHPDEDERISTKPFTLASLLRMIRTDGTVATAGQFIPAAEQLGLVRLVDRHALEMTVAQLHAHPEVTLAVNVSGTTAGDPSWLQSFVNYVRANHQVAERMIVELTETAALHAFEESARGHGCSTEKLGTGAEQNIGGELRSSYGVSASCDEGTIALVTLVGGHVCIGCLKPVTRERCDALLRQISEAR